MNSRTPSLEDVPAIVALLGRIGDADGTGWVSAAEVSGWLTDPGNTPENFRLFEDGGEPVAYADLLQPGEEGEKAWLDVRVLPERRGGDIEDVALAWAEERARGLGVRLLRAQVVPGPLDAALARRGYRTIRHSFRMQLALDAEPAAPAWPAGIEVREMRQGEEHAVYEADMEAFADHWEFVAPPFERWLHHGTAEGIDPSLWFLALDGEEIAGICLCAVNERAGCPTGWVSTLGVRPHWRRRGLGRALLLHAFRAFRERGLPVALLGVDGENTTGAVRLYEGVGMHVAHRYDSWELALG